MVKIGENKVLVCINEHPNSNTLLRVADKKAKELNCGWIVLYVEPLENYSIDKDSQRRILHFLALAKEMGAEIHHIKSYNSLETIITFIDDLKKSNNLVEHLIIGQNSNVRFFSRFKSSLSEKIARKLRKTAIEIHIIPLIENSNSTNFIDQFKWDQIKIRGIAFAFAITLVAGLISEVAQRLLPVSWQVKISIVIALFLLSSIISSMLHGLIPGLIVSILGFLLIDYLYIFPIYSFEIGSPSDVINMVIFLISSIVLSFMGAFNKGYGVDLLRKRRRSQVLYEIYRLASEARDKDHAIRILHNELSKLLEAEVVFFLPSDNENNDKKIYPPDINLKSEDEEILLKCWQESCATGLGTSISFKSEWRFEPLATARDEIGVIGVKIPNSLKLDASFGLLLKTVAEQAGAILERINLVAKMNESQMREEREKLRSLLLSSISHDLKTPLSSIIGCLSVYKRMQNSQRLTNENASELTETALEEAQRLNSFISNILEMTRIESGDVEFHKEWMAPNIVIEQVISNMRNRLKDHELIFHDLDKKIEVEMDVEMTKQVLQNIIDNAIKYSPKNSQIIISCQLDENGFLYKIKDCGPGIANGKFEAIFDKYERLMYSDSKVAGTGLGLSICRAIMTEQGGFVRVTNHKDGGAEFVVWLSHFREINEVVL